MEYKEEGHILIFQPPPQEFIRSMEPVKAASDSRPKACCCSPYNKEFFIFALTEPPPLKGKKPAEVGRKFF